jgi:hypothetical protein
MMRRYFSWSGQPKDDAEKKAADAQECNDKDNRFLEVKNFFMIFGGRSAQLMMCQRKHERREVYTVEPATLSFLDWSGEAITFDRDDHPDYILNPGHYPLIIDPVISNTRLTKVLMDGGSGLNILYAETLDLMGISRSQLRANAAPFHGVVSRQRATPLGQIDLPVCFGTPSNFRRETLTFEVVGFRGTYHAILGRPCYARFMAVPNYICNIPAQGLTGSIGYSYQ